jgi:cardiolipin synthase A/B
MPAGFSPWPAEPVARNVLPEPALGAPAVVMRRLTRTQLASPCLAVLFALASTPARAEVDRRPDGRLETMAGLLSEPLTHGNDLELLVGGPEYFPRRLEMIEGAGRSIDLVMSLWCADTSGMAVAEALVAAAARGVRVRVVVDFFNFKRPAEVYALLEASDVDLVIFNPPRWGWRLNERIHEKILVVDGEAALLGGANLCDEYMIEGAARGLWRDYEIFARGPVAHRTQARFDETWNRIVADARRVRGGYATVIHTDPTAFATGLSKVYDLRGPPASAPSGPAAAFLHYQQPYHHGDHEEEALRLYRHMLASARSRVILQAPYLVPPPAFKDALIEASERGVEVIVLTNSPQTTLMGGFWAVASRVRYRRLMEAGVRIYESPAETVHGKALLVDEHLAAIGSHNFTPRSFRHNGEVKLITDDTKVVGRLLEAFARDRDEFVEITLGELDAGAEPRGLRRSLGRLIGRVL